MLPERKISMMCMGADPAWRRVIPDDAKRGSEKQASFFRSEEGGEIMQDKSVGPCRLVAILGAD